MVDVKLYVDNYTTDILKIVSSIISIAISDQEWHI